MGWEDNRLDMGLGALWGAAMGRIPCRRIRQGARSASRQPLPRRTLERPGAETPDGVGGLSIRAHQARGLALVLVLVLDPSDLPPLAPPALPAA